MKVYFLQDCFLVYIEYGITPPFNWCNIYIHTCTYTRGYFLAITLYALPIYSPPKNHI